VTCPAQYRTTDLRSELQYRTSRQNDAWATGQRAHIGTYGALIRPIGDTCVLSWSSSPERVRSAAPATRQLDSERKALG
jgi:hypothetical protein